MPVVEKHACNKRSCDHNKWTNHSPTPPRHSTTGNGIGIQQCLDSMPNQHRRQKLKTNNPSNKKCQSLTKILIDIQ